MPRHLLVPLLLGAITTACYTSAPAPPTPAPRSNTIACQVTRVTLIDGHSHEILGPRITNDTLRGWDGVQLMPVAVPVSAIRGVEASIVACRVARITLVDGRSKDVLNPTIANDTLRGWDRRDAAPVVVPLSQIRPIEVRRFDIQGTVGLALGIAAVLSLVSVVAVTIALQGM